MKYTDYLTLHPLFSTTAAKSSGISLSTVTTNYVTKKSVTTKNVTTTDNLDSRDICVQN